MLIVDTLLYLLLTWYIEEVYTGKYGVAKPLYFPFMPSYWLGQRGRGMCVKKRGAHHVRLEEEGREEEEEDGAKLIGGWTPDVYIYDCMCICTRSITGT